MSSAALTRSERRGLTKRELREEIEAYLFLLPWIVGFIAFTIGPMLASLLLALSDYQIVKPPQFIGLANFERVFLQDVRFWDSLRITSIYTVASVPLHVALGFGVIAE